MIGTRIYQGWRYTFDESRPAKIRWQATRDGESLKAPSESALKKLVDAGHEEQSRIAAMRSAERQSYALA